MTSFCDRHGLSTRDRDDRYGSVAELAADIERHRSHEPVRATPPTLRYRARKLRALPQEATRLVGARCSRDEGRLVVSSIDGTARLWEAAMGAEVLTFRGLYERLIASARLSVDGRRVMTGSLDGTVRIWPMDPVALALRYAPQAYGAGEG